jgi:mRNA interferase MazF
MASSYIPDRGDLVWLTFNPQSGHEQSGRRPALVLSPKLYNQKTGLGIFCPVTSQIKGYPFEVPIPQDLNIQGVLLSDQVKNLDWQARMAEFICKMPLEVLNEVISKLKVLVT